jgi:hypothetical protein
MNETKLTKHLHIVALVILVTACDRPSDTALTVVPAAAQNEAGGPTVHNDGCVYCKLSVPAPDDTKIEDCTSLPQDGSYGRSVSAKPPPTLEATGLYCILSKGLISPGIVPFRPRFHLWSDGSMKSRWIYLPPGSQIDNADPDHWSFPVGTKVWKEFVFAGKRVETRLIERYGEGPEDFLYASYQWNAEGTAAVLAPTIGVREAAPITMDANGPRHDISSPILSGA